MLYKLCKRLIECDRTKGLEEKIDAFYAVDKLTKQEYDELISMLHPEQNKV